jgi:hypothetical protein
MKAVLDDSPHGLNNANAAQSSSGDRQKIALHKRFPLVVRTT